MTKRKQARNKFGCWKSKMSRHRSEARLGDQTEDKSVSDVELPQQCLIKEYSRLQAMSQLELEAGAVWRFFSSPLSRHRADTNWRRWNLKLNMF